MVFTIPYFVLAEQYISKKVPCPYYEKSILFPPDPILQGANL